MDVPPGLLSSPPSSGSPNSHLPFQASEVVSAVVEVLLSHGAEVNRVAKGHSPLSLAILSGHDSVSSNIEYTSFLYGWLLILVIFSIYSGYIDIELS